MQIYLNDDQELDVRFEDRKETMKDLQEAMARFFEENPLGCDTCPPRKHCCKQGLAIGVDHVAILANSRGDVRGFAARSLEYAPLSVPRLKTIPKCCFLAKDGRCGIYQTRPMACRNYQCRYKNSDRLKVLLDLESLYVDTAAIEVMTQTIPGQRGRREILLKSFDLVDFAQYQTYDAPLKDCLRWSLQPSVIERDAHNAQDDDPNETDPNIRAVPNAVAIRKQLLKEIEASGDRRSP